MNNKKSVKSGLPPGSLLHVGDEQARETVIHALEYNADDYIDRGVVEAKNCTPLTENNRIKWYEVNGLKDVEGILEIGTNFNIHNLVLEDILNTNHRPKFEDHHEYLFLAIKTFYISKNGKSVDIDQVSFLMGDDWVISLFETDTDIYDGLKDRIKNRVGAIRDNNCQFLSYRLLDILIDNYYFITEHFNDQIEKFDSTVLEAPSEKNIIQMQLLKQNLLQIMHSIAPTKEALLQMYKLRQLSTDEKNQIYLRDVNDHITQIYETLASQREMIANLMDLNFNMVSFKLNKIMKVLTIVSTIFIPLTFIAGIYGMNFVNMPELEMPNAYFIVWGIMIFITLVMLYLFRKNKWL